MVGLRLTQAMQDSIEGFLIQQVSLRHSRATSSLPRSPLSPLLRPIPAPETHTSGPEKKQSSRCSLKVETLRDVYQASASLDSVAEGTPPERM